MSAVIFDLDGTLVDSAPDIHAAANATLAEMGRAAQSLDMVRGFIGNGIPKLVERVMAAASVTPTEANHTEWTAAFVAHYQAAPADLSTCYTGVERALADLRSSGFALGVCTNKAEALTHQVLNGLGLAEYFSAVVGGDTLPVKKPDPAPFRACLAGLGETAAVYVGDSEVDAATAVAAGAPFVLFTEGYRKTPVATIPHKVAISSFDQLGPAIDALSGVSAA